MVEYAADFDVKVFVEEEDPYLTGDSKMMRLGPNPKIRNLSRGYREARGDIVWVIDCNVWVGKGVAGRMVDKLCGFTTKGRGKKYKFVHQLPVVVDTTWEDESETSGSGSLPLSKLESDSGIASISPSHCSPNPTTPARQISAGGRLEELFLSSSHAKFYTAINTVLIAPCIVGKSNMFRRSHLNHLTANRSSYSPYPGIDFFSNNICEDHLIGDLLWRGTVPEEEAGETWGKHALVLGDLSIQPITRVSVREYVARRVRWLRVRKFTVTLATLVEPGTESFLASICGAYAVTTLPIFNNSLHIPQTWVSFAGLWLLSITLWALVDRTLYLVLHSSRSVEVDGHTPGFAKALYTRRTFWEWAVAWLGRESLAFPIWAWAVFGGTTVMWRGRAFRVGVDMRVHEVGDKKNRWKTRID
jgi:ceramide glucosyltransferase